MTKPSNFLRPAAPPSDDRRISSALPSDLLDAVRVRIRLLALLLLVAFAFDPVIFAGALIVSAITGNPLSSEFLATAPFQWISLGAVAASAALWLTSRRRSVSSSKLHTLGLAYEIAICFCIAFAAYWQYHMEHSMLPNLTWVPVVVVLFPLILPGPPMRMLGAAIIAGAMAPFAMGVLELTGRVVADSEAYIQSSISSAFAIGFAYWGARVVYGLGRELAAAREMGSYRLESVLGRGGMGEVWLARHRLLARPAAIKVIRPSVTTDADILRQENMRRRFEREAQVIASLRSPHTVELFDFGIAHDESFYYVMELLEGLDADKIVRRFGPMPAERVIHVLRGVCHSLSEAESHGLVHRDIKPANVYLCQYGEDFDFVKVLDFGLVKTFSQHIDTETALSGEQIVHGTPEFMAPEQAMDPSHIDGRADIYATGCLAYWMLTGELVFTAESPVAYLMQHAQTVPQAPSTRTELPVPAALDQLVLSCLAKSPTDRPQSARELSRALDDIPVDKPWTPERAQEWWEINRPV